ncbi:hypothetical protein BDV29DRAFT_169017 [Aspergillus leporis]|uniref:Uncharacterized protein n=1 Tax=Aspergillus leporis TaxID=41062 RepID=A0A5N5X8P9_9EURO|nr:hypothetical protein BDV29DRAFT_169017 [Aspergillus leporis]
MYTHFLTQSSFLPFVFLTFTRVTLLLYCCSRTFSCSPLIFPPVCLLGCFSATFVCLFVCM